MKGKIILINGVSSSGKSTLIQKMTEFIPDYLIISLDNIGELIFKMRNQRRTPTTGEIVFQSNYQLFLKPYLFHRIIELIHDYSYNIIVDALMDDDDVLQDFYSIFANEDVTYVAVHCPLEELERREKARGDRPIGLAKTQLANFHNNIKYDIEVDTFENTIEECALKIINLLNN